MGFYLINEDKQLGPYFISRNIVAPDNNEIDSNKFAEVFKHKVIMYLFEDAARQKRSEILKVVHVDGTGIHKYFRLSMNRA